MIRHFSVVSVKVRENGEIAPVLAEALLIKNRNIILSFRLNSSLSAQEAEMLTRVPQWRLN